MLEKLNQNRNTALYKILVMTKNLKLFKIYYKRTFCCKEISSRLSSLFKTEECKPMTIDWLIDNLYWAFR